MIRRSPSPTRNYTALHNAVLSDSRLSWEARGLLAYLLSKPDNWSVYPKHLIKESPNARRDRVYRILDELKSTGYLVRSQERSEGGRMGEVEYVVYDTPQPQNHESSRVSTASGFSVSGSAVSGSTVSGKHGRIIKTDVEQRLIVENTEVQQTVLSAEAEEHAPVKSARKPRVPVGYSAEFEHLWSIYPRRIAKAAAWSAVQTLLRSGITYEALTEAAENYAFAMRRVEVRYILHPSTFYGPQRRFEDFLMGGEGWNEAQSRTGQNRGLPEAFSGIAEFLAEGDE